MDKLLTVLLGALRRLLVESVSGPRMEHSKALTVAAVGGLVAGFIIIGMMAWLGPVARMSAPLDAAARGMFSGLAFGMLGGVAMALLSNRIHGGSSGVRRVVWSTAMLLGGGSLLLASHVLGAKPGAVWNRNPEWAALFVHGAIGSTTAINMIDFYAVRTGFRCLLVAAVASLLGGLGYGAVVTVAVATGEDFIWQRGPFVVIATVVYLATILFSLFIARMGEPRMRNILSKSVGNGA